MVRAVIVMNTEGKPRPLKFYDFRPPEKQQELIRSVFTGYPAGIQAPRHAVFCFVFDGCENELPMLDLSQVPVETLDRCFKNVGELDIVFYFNKMHTVLDEIIFGGQVLETSS